MNNLSVIFLTLILNVVHCKLFNIIDYGAIPGQFDDQTAQTNSLAIEKAFQAASIPGQLVSDELFWSKLDSTVSSDLVNTVLVPSGNFYVFRCLMENISNVVLQMDGEITVNNNVTLWQQTFPKGSGASLYFVNTHDITIMSKSIATVDGQGYNFWWATILSGHDNRPHLFAFDSVVQLKMYNLHLRNSPQFHVKMDDSRNIWTKSITIRVDVVAQQNLINKASKLLGSHANIIKHKIDLEPFHSSSKLVSLGLKSISIPTFPLNTDGFDPQAENVLMEDIDIENFDDAIAVKPCRNNYVNCKCSSNQLYRNLTLSFTVGASIGSVPPNGNVNCVRNITFEDVKATHPIKLIYIKSNPGTSGTGTITDIKYIRVVATSPLWYPIWIGPQQQHQPGDGPSGGTGCSFLYPLNKTCATQPLVTMKNIQIVNFTSTGGLTLPGVILANSLNPYEIQFINVSNEGPFLVSKDYACQNTNIFQSNTKPALKCVNQTSTIDESASVTLY